MCCLKVRAKLNVPLDQMEIYRSYESQPVSAGEYDDKIGELYSFYLLKLSMSLVADHVVHSGVNTDQAKHSTPEFPPVNIPLHLPL